MIKMNIRCCKWCPFFQAGEGVFATCGHADIPKTFDYPVPRSVKTIDAIPKWCPIQKGATLVTRNKQGNVESKIKLKIIGQIKKE